MSDLGELVSVVGGALLVAILLLAGITTGIMRGIAHPVDVSSCRAFGASSGYEVKFADYNFFEWDCLAKTANGKWVSTETLRGVNQ